MQWVGGTGGGVCCVRGVDTNAQWRSLEGFLMGDRFLMGDLGACLYCLPVEPGPLQPPV